MDKIDVSVICLAYNHEGYVEQALNSILKQKTSYTYEILIGEDASQDRTKEILMELEIKYPERFRIFYREKNIGGTRNLYELLQVTRGRYIANLELDDFWTSDEKLQRQIDFLEKNKSYIGCVHDYTIVNEKNEPLVNKNSENIQSYYNQDFTLHDFLLRGFLFQTATLVYRNIWHDGADYSVIYKSHTLVADLTTNSILLNKGSYFVLPYTMSSYRLVQKIGGSNAASIAMKKRAGTLMDTWRQLAVLDKYFDGTLDYSYKREGVLTGYFLLLIKQESDADIRDFFNLVKQMDFLMFKRFISHCITCFTKKRRIKNEN